ncbi:MAG: aromatic amino acid lyase [bacterium]|nr:aromatic amino acid lyase [bacterium]
MSRVITLDGSSLTLTDLVRVARDPAVQVAFDPAATERVKRGWKRIERIGEDYETAYRAWRGDGASRPMLDYGVTTGFGEFKDIPIRPRELEQLQRNILLSHSVGVGETTDPDDPANYFPAEVIRAVLVIRLNAFLKGHSGIRVELVECVGRMLNRGVVPLVPIRGSVGASGDLCPLAHLFVVLLGEGRYYVVREGDMSARRGRFEPASKLGGDLGAQPVQPRLKEGLALTNGATFCAALLALGVADAESVANVADVAAALALEAVCGCARALDPQIHRSRGLEGQIDSAANMRTLVRGSRQVEAAGAVQDVYSVRCAPQVHGASRDAIAHARMVVEREINAATDNPLFFPGEGGERHAAKPFDLEFSGNWPEGYRGGDRASYSAGNFHGQPLGLAADFLAIALSEIADISERRVQLMLDHTLNRHLPANLIPRRGVNSGYMLIQYCAAGIVSENKVLSHPATVDSIPTSANSEDHVAMATHAGRKLRTVVGNAQAVLAIELLVAAQAVEWRIGMGIDPVNGSNRLDREDPAYRDTTDALDRAELEAQEFRARTAAEYRGDIAGRLGRGTGAAYLEIRQAAEPMLADRTLDEDIRRVRRLVEYSPADGGSRLLGAVENALEARLRRIGALRTGRD